MKTLLLAAAIGLSAGPEDPREFAPGAMSTEYLEKFVSWGYIVQHQKAVKELMTRRALDQILEGLETQADLQRSMMAWSVRWNKGVKVPELVGPMEKLLDDRRLENRQAGVDYLAVMGVAKAAPRIAPFLRNEAAFLRHSAINYFLAVKPEGWEKRLREVAENDPDEAVRKDARKSLENNQQP